MKIRFSLLTTGSQSGEAYNFWTKLLTEAKAGQQLAAAQGKHIGWPKGLNAENLSKVKKALDKGLAVPEIVELTGISLSSVKCYRKCLKASLSH